MSCYLFFSYKKAKFYISTISKSSGRKAKKNITIYYLSNISHLFIVFFFILLSFINFSSIYLISHGIYKQLKIQNPGSIFIKKPIYKKIF